MQKREKLLAIAAGGVLLIFGGQLLFTEVVSRFKARTDQIAALEKEIDDKDLKIAKGKKAQERLDSMRAQSLPEDEQLGRSLYQNWLLATADNAKLKNVEVIASQPLRTANSYTRFPFTLRASGGIDQITQFLFDFYQTAHLHQIVRLNLIPDAKDQSLTLFTQVEALAVPGSTNKARLADAKTSILKQADAETYRKSIASRNFFSAYQPPPPPPRDVERPRVEEKKPPEFDVSKYTFVTAIMEEDGVSKVWLRVRPTGQLVVSQEGETVEIGKETVKILQINSRAFKGSVEIELDGARRVIRLGESLRGGTEAIAVADEG